MPLAVGPSARLPCGRRPVDGGARAPAQRRPKAPLPARATPAAPADARQGSEPSTADFCGAEGRVLVRGNGAQNGSGNGKNYHIHTFGCQMNIADSERMAGVLEGIGYRHVEDPENAHLLIYNTCSIREKAESKVYSALGMQAKRKRSKESDLKIVVAGCVASQEGHQLLRRMPEVDLVMGPQHANKIEELLERVDLGAQVVATEDVDIMEDIAQPRRGSDITAWVNVIYGCNERCTYCVVPNTRGKEQSRTPDAIKKEMTALGAAGYKEVTLLGQNVDAYGRDLPGMASDASGRRAWTFTDLLRHVHDVPGIERIRFATSHPRYFTERLIQACAELPKMCEFFHIPFQCGDDDVLREMRRGYTAARYANIIHNIRRRMPDASISGDAIVGFPGETEEQFMRTVDLVKRVGFDRVNTAAYSPRPNTPAAFRPDQVADLIKKDRLNRLNAVVNEVAEARAQRFAGRELEVLVEGANPREGGQAMGRSRHNKVVFFEGDGEALKGRLVAVRVERVRAYTLYGRLLDAGGPSL
ncbi:unnamed protein product [Ostreobium quekettii]|uniref:Uncharacterized protein n=1 Tax=Ostreobium quekettii TaxID=121088 RepID=A0A8S1IKF8_9CHLO|nr:unnamed protein product [Ostreobium quekettii]